MTPENTDSIQGKFKKGQSGNPAGKPKGSRNKATLAVQALLDGEAEAITRKAIEKAKDGDMAAIRLVIERVLPPRREVMIEIDLPPIDGIEGIIQAQSAILKAVCQGDITPTEASAISAITEQALRAFESRSIEQRLDAMETRLGQRQKL